MFFRFPLLVLLTCLCMAGCGPLKPANSGKNATTPQGSEELSGVPKPGENKPDAGNSDPEPEPATDPKPQPPADPDPAAEPKVPDSLSGTPEGELILLLADDSQREAASSQLVELEAVEALVAALGSEDKNVQAGAIYTLGRLGPAAKPALPELKKLADSQNEVVRDSALFAIDAIEAE